MESNNRDKSIDIAKGFLIICLVLHHIIDYSQSYFNINNSFLLLLKEYQRPLYLCYFMQCFFLITGFCSNFDSQATTFITKQIKSLVIPNIFYMVIYCMIHRRFSTILQDFILQGGYLWFLTSLFTCKCVFYYLHRIIKSVKILLSICIILSILGTFLNDMDYFPNYWWHRQSLDLLLFLVIGYLIRKYIISKRTWFLPIIYIISLIVILVANVKIPHVTAGFNTTIITWLPHIILSVSGSITVIKICKLVKQRPILEYLGKNTLPIYMWHSEILLILLDTYAYILIENKIGRSIICTITIFITTIVISLLLAWMMNRKYTKWSLGKF